jgi:hypothetical protein
MKAKRKNALAPRSANGDFDADFDADDVVEEE